MENFAFRKKDVSFYGTGAVSIAYLLSMIPQSDFPDLTRAAARTLFFSPLFPAGASSLPPIISHLARDRRHKDIPRSPAGHLLNSSAYVSLIRVCKSVAMGEGRRDGGGGRDREQAGRRIACGQVVGVRASTSCGLRRVVKNTCPPRYPFRATPAAAKGLFTGWSDQNGREFQFCESPRSGIAESAAWSCDNLRHVTLRGLFAYPRVRTKLRGKHFRQVARNSKATIESSTGSRVKLTRAF